MSQDEIMGQEEEGTPFFQSLLADVFIFAPPDASSIAATREEWVGKITWCWRLGILSYSLSANEDKKG